MMCAIRRQYSGCVKIIAGPVSLHAGGNIPKPGIPAFSGCPVQAGEGHAAGHQRLGALMVFQFAKNCGAASNV